MSYNVACKPPEENLEELLGFEKSEENLPDFYIVGLQEVKAQLYNIVLDALLDDPWTIAFKQVTCFFLSITLLLILIRFTIKVSVLNFIF